MLPKRTTWFGLGVATGALGAAWGYVRAREAATVDPDAVARLVVGAARTVGERVGDLIDESRRGMVDAETELRAGLDRRRSTPGAQAPLRSVEGAAARTRRRAGRGSVG